MVCDQLSTKMAALPRLQHFTFSLESLLHTNFGSEEVFLHQLLHVRQVDLISALERRSVSDDRSLLHKTGK